jgi:hypothetical protein
MLLPGGSWPSPLADMGYEIEWVERSFSVGKMGKLQPDVFSKSDEMNRVLLLECKGGNSIESRQLEKYLSVEADDVATIVSVRNKDLLSIGFAYVTGSYAVLKEAVGLAFHDVGETIRNSKGPDDVDAIEIQSDSIQVWTKNEQNWTSELIQGIPCEEGCFPQHFIPFSMNDDGEWVMKLIARSLVSLLRKTSASGGSHRPTIDAREMVQNMFGVYKFLPESERRELIGRMEHYFLELSRNSRLRRSIESLGRGSRITARNLQAAIDALTTFGTEIEKKERSTARLDKILEDLE